MTDIDNTTPAPADFGDGFDEVPPDYDYNTRPPEGVEYADDPEFEAAPDELAGAVAAEVAEPSTLTDALTEAVRKAVAAQVAEAAKEIAKGVIASALTEAVVAGMRETAVNEAAVATDPDRVVEEPEEEKRELRFRTLDAFVEEYLGQTYRREVTARGTEEKTRWCPEWWNHGEAVARLRHLWTAFEQMRLDPGQEMSAWWIQHCDPHMDRLLDTQGPFKYCSVSGGHKDKLTALPTVTPPAGLFPDDEDSDSDPQPAAPLTSSRLILPAAPTGNRRVVYRSFP